jgi:catechol 2,3-dioxygenase-like lactoylglutathione lyase family enzyme
MSQMQLSRISAVMLGVRDLEQSLAFYKEKLGLQVIMKEQAIALLKCGDVMLGLSRGHVSLAPQVAGATEVVFAVENVRGPEGARGTGSGVYERATPGNRARVGGPLQRS